MLGVTYKQEDEIKTLNVTNFNIVTIWHMKLDHISTKTKTNLVYIEGLSSFYEFFFSIHPSYIKGKHYGIKFIKEHQKFKKFWNLYIVMYVAP
jgi:hypothetical protein